jgi:hypothetical protein
MPLREGETRDFWTAMLDLREAVREYVGAGADIGAADATAADA